MLLVVIYEVIIVHFLLKKHGFGDTVKLYNKKFGNNGNNSSLHDKRLRKIIGSIDKVCFIFWGDAECLHRSLIGYKILRKLGLEIDMVVGVKKFPFSSHAWLELNGKIINDSEQIKTSYTEILRVGRETS